METSASTVSIREQRLLEKYAKMPITILRSPRLSPGAKLAYLVLVSYAWQDGSCFPGQTRMAEDIGVTERSVHTYIKELVAAGLVSVRRIGLGKTNLYTLEAWAGAEIFSDQHRKQTSTPDLKRFPTKKMQRTKIETPRKKTQNIRPEPPTDPSAYREALDRLR